MPPSVFRLATEKIVLGLHVKPGGPKGCSSSASGAGRGEPIAGQPREREAKVPLELQEQLEEREAVNESSVKRSSLYVIWHGNLLKCYFRRQEENVFVYSPLVRKGSGL